MSIEPKKVKGDLALNIDVAKISSVDFLLATKAFIGLVKEVARTLDISGTNTTWDISVNEGSQVINIYCHDAPSTPFVSNLAKAVLDGLDTLENKIENPFFENDKALQHVHTLSKLSKKETNPLPIRLLSKEQERPLTHNIYHHTDALLSQKYEDNGTVDGLLDMVSAHNTYEFKISEILTGKTIKCLVSEALLEKALICFRKRVEVIGLISYSREGFPKQVKATEIIKFPDTSEIPHYSRLKGILRNC